MVITDGRSNTGVANIQRVSDTLSKQGVNIIAIGVGAAHQPELKALATDDKNIFTVGSLSQLKHAVWSVKRASCTGKVFNLNFKSTVEYNYSFISD